MMRDIHIAHLDKARPVVVLTREPKFVGDAIAAVVAPTARDARIAASLVEVDYEPGPAVFGEMDAIASYVTNQPIQLALLELRLELRRGDYVAVMGAVSITRGVTFVSGGAVVGPPKTDAGVRVVALPERIQGLMEE